MKKIICLYLLLNTVHFVYAQTTLTYQITDCKTKEPIMYAHIGITEKGIGTISNEQGYFTLKIPTENIKDTLTISFVGYETKRLLIQSIKANIQLCPANIQLKELVVMPKKEKILGKKNEGGNSAVGTTIGNGAEIAKKISNNKSIAVRKVGFYLHQYYCDSLKISATFYKADNNQIGEIINVRPYIWTVSALQKKGWIEYELPVALPIQGDFMVAIEMISSKSNDQKCQVMFWGNYQPLSKSNFKRYQSHGKWEMEKIDIPIRVVVNYD